MDPLAMISFFPDVNETIGEVNFLYFSLPQGWHKKTIPDHINEALIYIGRRSLKRTEKHLKLTGLIKTFDYRARDFRDAARSRLRGRRYRWRLVQMYMALRKHESWTHRGDDKFRLDEPAFTLQQMYGKSMKKLRREREEENRELTDAEKAALLLRETQIFGQKKPRKTPRGKRPREHYGRGTRNGTSNEFGASRAG